MRYGRLVRTIVVLCGIAGGVFFVVWKLGWPDDRDLVATGQAFLDDLAEGRIDNAYSRTSKSLRVSYSRDQFQELIDRYPLLKEKSRRTFSGYDCTRGTFSAKGHYKTTISSPEGSLAVILSMLPEGGQWKVDDLAFEGKQRGRASSPNS